MCWRERLVASKAYRLWLPVLIFIGYGLLSLRLAPIVYIMSSEMSGGL